MNIANTGIYVSDPTVLFQLAERLKDVALEMTHNVEAGNISVDTKWSPPTDIIVDVCTEMKMEAKVVYSELNLLGLGLMHIRLVNGEIRTSTHTFDTPTICAELEFIESVDSDLYKHVAWMHEHFAWLEEGN